MTLIQPNKHNNLLNALLIFLGVVVTGAVISLIFVYNQTVSLTQGASVMQEQIVKLQAENSEIKSATFALLDPDRLSRIAVTQGMTSDAAPRYVKIATWVADSHL